MDEKTTKMLFEALTSLTEKIAALEGGKSEPAKEDSTSILRFAKKQGNVNAALPNFWEASKNLEAHKAMRAKFRSQKGFWGTGKAA
jgi:hypothetical protein